MCRFNSLVSSLSSRVHLFRGFRLRYFSHSSQVSVNSWSTVETGALDPCGHCDNCKRAADSFEKRDVTLATWQLLKILQAVVQQGGRLTLGKLAALARGGAKGEYDVSTKKGRKTETETFRVDLDAVAGGPVEMSRLVGFNNIYAIKSAQPFPAGYRTPHRPPDHQKIFQRGLSSHCVYYECLRLPRSAGRASQSSNASICA